jgi:hypothetical protein
MTIIMTIIIIIVINNNKNNKIISYIYVYTILKFVSLHGLSNYFDCLTVKVMRLDDTPSQSLSIPAYAEIAWHGRGLF